VPWSTDRRPTGRARFNASGSIGTGDAKTVLDLDLDLDLATGTALAGGGALSLSYGRAGGPLPTARLALLTPAARTLTV
jgi:hypothetical protein